MNRVYNSRGQALVESLFSFPLLASGITLVLAGLHSLFAFYLTDFFTYQSAQCLVQEKPRSHCLKQLQEQLNLLPYTRFEVKKFSRDSFQSEVITNLTTPFIENRIFKESIVNNLKSHNFGAHQ